MAVDPQTTRAQAIGNRYATETPVQRLAHEEIDQRYAKPKRRTLRGCELTFLRLKDLFLLLTARWEILPHDDAGHDDAVIVANHIAALPNPLSRDRYVREWQALMPPGFDLAEAIEQIDTPRKYTAAHLGLLMRLTGVERIRYGIGTIRAHDAGNDAALKAKRHERDRLRKAHIRAAERARKPLPLSVTRPWELLGVSRATWFRMSQTPSEIKEQKASKIMKREPLIVTQPWLVEGISRRTWFRRRHKAGTGTETDGVDESRADVVPPRLNLSAAKPWQAEGISRRTWYRRRGTAACETKPVLSTLNIIAVDMMRETLAPNLRRQELCNETVCRRGRRSVVRVRIDMQPDLAGKNFD